MVHQEIPVGEQIDSKIVDCDSHIREAPEDIVPYMSGEARRIVENSNPIPKDGWDRRVGGRLERHTVKNAQDKLETMDSFGVDTGILFPTSSLYHGLITDPDVAVEYARGYNDYLLNDYLDKSERLMGAMLVPVQRPERAADEIDRVATEDGIVAVFLPPLGSERALGDERYDPIYAAAEKHGLPIMLHGGATTYPKFPLQTDYFHKFLEAHSISHSFQQMTQVTSLLCRGVPVKFPDLTFVTMEAGFSWIPFLYRLDKEFIGRQQEAPLLERYPSEYFKDSFNVTTQPLEEINAEGIENLVSFAGGWENVMFSTDFPHRDFDSPSVVFEYIPDEKQDLVLHENAESCFDLQ